MLFELTILCFLTDPHITQSIFIEAAWISMGEVFFLKPHFTCLPTCSHPQTREVFPEKGKLTQPALDTPEIAEMVYEARTLLQMILSAPCPRGPDDSQALLSAVTDSCRLAFRECFHAFFPSVPLKWFALCQQLQYLDPVSVRDNCSVDDHCNLCVGDGVKVAFREICMGEGGTS